MCLFHGFKEILNGTRSISADTFAAFMKYYVLKGISCVYRWISYRVPQNFFRVVWRSIILITHCASLGTRRLVIG